MAVFAPLLVATLVMGVMPNLVFTVTNASAALLADTYRAATGL